MGAWAKDQKAGDKAYARRRLGRLRQIARTELDLTARGMGVRCQHFSMLVDNGVVKTLNVEAQGSLVSDAETMLKRLG
jgi:peroxiredoxin